MKQIPFKSEIIPTRFKIVSKTPVFNFGDPQNVSNYGPISDIIFNISLLVLQRQYIEVKSNLKTGCSDGMVLRKYYLWNATKVDL